MSRIGAETPGVCNVTAIRPPATGSTVLHQTQGTLALAFDADGPAAEYPVLVADAPEDADAAHDRLVPFVTRFSAALVEVLAGDRGPAQLLRCTSPQIYDDLVRRSQLLAHVGGSDQRLHRQRPRIRSVHVSCPRAGAAEFSIHVRQDHRSRAVAGRLVWRRGTWICVALQFG